MKEGWRENYGDDIYKLASVAYESYIKAGVEEDLAAELAENIGNLIKTSHEREIPLPDIKVWEREFQWDAAKTHRFLKDRCIYNIAGKTCRAAIEDVKRSWRKQIILVMTEPVWICRPYQAREEEIKRRQKAVKAETLLSLD